VTVFHGLVFAQKRAAPGEAAASGTGRGAAAKKAKTNTGAAAAAAGAGGEGGIEIDGVGTMTEAELAGWAQNGQVHAHPATYCGGPCYVVCLRQWVLIAVFVRSSVHCAAGGTDRAAAKSGVQGARPACQRHQGRPGGPDHHQAGAGLAI
jgi:hypothetical protein